MAAPLNHLTSYELQLRIWEPEYWRPHVREIWSRHGLPGGGDIVASPGTNVVLLVDGRFAVKFFSLHGDPAESFLSERDFYRIAGRHPALPVPKLAGEGYLLPASDTWRWPYLVTSLEPGVPFEEVRDGVAFADRAEQARFIGGTLRQLHELAIDDGVHLQPTWDAFESFVRGQRMACRDNHDTWETLPDQLIAQLDDYVSRAGVLCDATSRPRLLHCDVVARHVLGQFDGGRWRASALIDFGDAKVGDPLYDFAAVHVGLFRCDKRLLRLFLDSYGWPRPITPQFVHRCMTYTLLHEFYIEWPTFPGLAEDTSTLDELATQVWDLDEPGLDGSERS